MQWGGRDVGRSGELVLAISLVYGDSRQEWRGTW